MRQDKKGSPGDKRFTEAVRDNQAATDVFDGSSASSRINRTDSRCLDIIDRLGRISAGHLANERAHHRGGDRGDRPASPKTACAHRQPLKAQGLGQTTEIVRSLTAHIFSFYDAIGPMAPLEQLKAIMEFLASASWSTCRWPRRSGAPRSSATTTEAARAGHAVRAGDGSAGAAPQRRDRRAISPSLILRRHRQGSVPSRLPMDLTMWVASAS